MANSKFAMAWARVERAQMDAVIEAEQMVRVAEWQQRRWARRLTELRAAGNALAELTAQKEWLQTVG